MADDAISWRVDTHEHVERSNDWYWGLALIALGGAAVSVLMGNILLALIIGLAAGSLWGLTARGPREHEVRLGTSGVIVDGTLYRWDNIESFWVEDERHLPAGEPPHLLLTTKGVLHPQLVLPLGDSNRARNVREYARRHCREVEQAPHLGHHVVRMLGL